MIPLTIHLITHNNESTVGRALESILPLEATVVVADGGSCDKTIAVCNSYEVRALKVSTLDRSKTRNEIIKNSKTEWQFYLEPWEILLSGHEVIKELVEEKPNSFHCGVLQDDIITKQIRLHGKNKTFSNPIFESIKDDNSEYAEIILYSEKKDTVDFSALEKWHNSNPLAVEPYYFKSCYCLANKKYKEFLSFAEHYLFKERKQKISAIMTRYYVSAVHCMVTKNLEEAVRNILICISVNPLMAEFWCLLGDIFFQAKEFKKSMAFYENAILLGKYRLKTDTWPMHLSKYEEYPLEMMESCGELLLP